MKPIDKVKLQEQLTNYFTDDVYVHLETTNGAYASHFNDKVMTVGAFIRNGKVQIKQGKITGDRPYRVGLEMNDGWIYAEGLTDWEIDEEGRLLMAGHDFDGRLAIALQLSHTPFA
ncbi:YojF family protein [Priestia koreensis]|uniref:DUF1806 domain-containing protein n=1 Tax=Priestia koreensis TaxID=284581 RepID=A0A0M0L5J8_9BACI|nr:YojF family protein [Priestia koreensis]KOO46346.1 hypothetical protein AMD01_10895 [Priestia koreensis]MCM3006449.1 YojF family protein [Priestia koreensis]UNL83650.1 YojF family protein [Priestia koreensis]